jgi:D-alanyl-D-alanine carboxypeptidase
VRAAGALKAQPQKPAKPAQPAPAPGNAPKELKEKAAAPAKPGTWSIQVGSYKSERAGEAGLANTGKVIPALVKGAGTNVVKGGNGTFQARFTGLAKASAEQACARLEAKGQDCLVLAPRK